MLLLPERSEVRERTWALPGEARKPQSCAAGGFGEKAVLRCPAPVDEADRAFLHASSDIDQQNSLQKVPADGRI